MTTTRGAATILDVAALAGVSRQTVTRAINDMADVSPTTRARVLAAAADLNYRPNRAAQSMVQGRSTTIGLVLDDLSNPYFAELASAFTRVAADREWSVMLCDLGADPERARKQLASIVSRVDALAMTGCRSGTMALLPDSLAKQNGFGLPVIMLDGPADPRLSARVLIDATAGVTAALDHLVRGGRRRIAFIDSDLGTDHRRGIYLDYLQQRDLGWNENPVVSADESLEGGIQAAELLVGRMPDADAILVYNDIMAIGVLKTLVRLGVAVPEDVAVIGMDGLEIGRHVTPELTSVSIDKVAVAEATVELLERVLSGSGAMPPDDAVIHPELLVRGSS
ncbi:LacI family transcriptional regulator [Serinibacter arcticus]|uniref:LacI family transcriptional regulator n=1 Tax=Serinibacter arcticus TaxID=1655435 RepID=A0A2U1ZXF7_9MICO|nr:LacI family DNA-binding transcriptional regulator [Serinibacter arcticus]PWD51630.1 LacI family transcriptional regulator [Serinibacter arcticus]